MSENPKKTRNTLIAAAVVAALTAGAVGSQAIALPNDGKPANAAVIAEPAEAGAFTTLPDGRVVDIHGVKKSLPLSKRHPKRVQSWPELGRLNRFVREAAD